MRVAIVASGSFSLEIGGPRISHGKRSGVPDPGWASSVLRRLEKAEVNELLNEATSDRLLKAGNIGGAYGIRFPTRCRPVSFDRLFLDW